MTCFAVRNLTTRRGVWILASSILGTAVLLGNLDLLSGKAAPTGDAMEYFAPLFSLTADHARSGKLLLWNPWVNAGSPDFSDPQIGASSPVVLLFTLIIPNPFVGFLAYWMVLWIVGALGMLLLCRHLHAPVWAALAISLGFLASGVFTGNAEHTSWICSFSLLPWILWRFDSAILDRSYCGVAQAGALWGLSALGGYPGPTIITPLFLALWGIGRLWIDGADLPLVLGSEKKLTYFIKVLLILVGIGIAVLCPAYLSFLKETRGYTWRAGFLDRQFSLGSGVLPPAAFGTFASPYLYLLNLPGVRPLWPETDVSMSNIYMSILVTMFGLGALLRVSRWRAWLVLLALLAACCAVGSHLPVRGWLYDLVPPTRYFRMPSLFRFYVILTFCVLAAYGFRDFDDSWENRTHNRPKGMVLLSSAIGAAALVTFYLILHGADRSVVVPLYALFHLYAGWVVAVLICLLWYRRVFSKRVLVCALVLLAVFDAGSTLYLSRPTIYSSEMLPFWRVMNDRHNSNLELQSRGWLRHLHPPDIVGSFVNDHNVAIKDAGFANRTPFKNRFFQHYLDDQALNSMAIGSNRTWFSDQPARLPPTEANFAAFAEAVHRLGSPVLLLHKPDEMKTSSNEAYVERSEQPGSPQPTAQAMSLATTYLMSYRPNSLIFRYHAERDGWLMVTDRWAPGWVARVNGQPREVLGADFIFRAVPVTRGDNLVEFRYKPRGYVPLIAVSWLTLAVVGGAQLSGLAARLVYAGRGTSGGQA
jgi:hypothetical protein